MIKEFIPYNLALELKSLGFDEPCFYQYVRDFDDDGELIPITSETKYPIIRNNTQVSHYSGGDCFAAPTFSQTFKFFREKYGLHSYIEPVLVEKANSPIKYDYVILEVSHQDDLEYNNLPYHTFEEAELECLKKLIEIVKQ